MQSYRQKKNSLKIIRTLTYKLVNEQCNSDDIEDEQIKYILSVFFQVCDNAINTTLDFPFVFVERWIDVKTSHSTAKKLNE